MPAMSSKAERPRLPHASSTAKIDRPARRFTMKRFKHILASTDLSPESFAAVHYAAHLAEGQGARLTILHIPQTTTLLFTDFAPPVDLMSLDRSIETAARETLEGWVRRHMKSRIVPRIVIRAGVTHA